MTVTTILIDTFLNPCSIITLVHSAMCCCLHLNFTCVGRITLNRLSSTTELTLQFHKSIRSIHIKIDLVSKRQFANARTSTFANKNITSPYKQIHV